MNRSLHKSRGNINRRRAIRERCLDCSAWSTKEVSECPMTDCVLFPFRMGKGKQNPKDRGKAIRAYCMWCCVGKPSEVRLCSNGDCPLHQFRMSVKNHQDAPLLKKNGTGKSISHGRRLDGYYSSNQGSGHD